MPNTSILVVDDFPLARAGVKQLLGRRARPIRETGSCLDAVAIVRAECPDLVVIDPAMDGGSGVEAIRSIREIRPETRILAMTISPDLALIARAIGAGADGFLFKTVSQETLQEAVCALMRGEPVIDPSLALDLVRGASRSSEAESIPEPLTPREREVIELVSRGHTNREIGAQLFMAVGTVKVHVEHILAKLGVPDRTSAAVEAARRGLVDEREQAVRPMPDGHEQAAARQIVGARHWANAASVGTPPPGRARRAAQRNRT